jgi:2'-5' RNA ligase
MKRTFVGIPAGSGKDFTGRIKDIQNLFSEERIRWTDPANFHVTLHFFGATSDKDIGVISRLIDDTAKEFSSFSFLISGLGVFRNLNHPRVLWLGLENIAELTQLRETLENRLGLSGFEKDKRPFRPHLTLGRMKNFKDEGKAGTVLREYQGRDFMEVKVSDIIYFESILSEKGAVYQPISRHLLGNDHP